MRNAPWFWQDAEAFERLYIETGQHDSAESGLCLMEAVAWLAREPHTDQPACVCPVLGTFGRRLNDILSDDLRQRLKPLIPAVIGTAGDGHAAARSWMAADWIVRTYTPTWLRLAKLDAEADALSSLPEIADLETLQGATDALNVATRSAGAAGDAARGTVRDEFCAAVGAAAWDAAWGAAWDAAWGAAWDAAGAAAGDVAWAAAWAAAWDAVGAAAGTAAGDVLAPTVRTLCQDAIRLYGDMIALGAEDRVERPLPTVERAMALDAASTEGSE